MSFLDRFQSKIATVTAHGHLKKADGSEEIRVGPPKRKTPANQPQAKPGESSTARSNQSHAQAPPVNKQQMMAAPIPAVNVKQQGKQSLPQEKGGQQSARQPQVSPTASPRNKTGRSETYDYNAYEGNNNYSHHPQQRNGHYYQYDAMPGRPQDSYEDYRAAPQKRKQNGGSPAKGNSPERYQPVYDERSRGFPPQQQQQPPPSMYQQNQPTNVKDNRGRNRSPESSPQKEYPSPRERNEARVQTDDDQLAFSRKARPVQFAPCTLSQYKKEKPAGYYELGKLQPDLNSSELVQKRANLERIKAFSKNLREINKVTAPSHNPEDDDAAQKKKKAQSSSRDKALAFAKHIPKPRIQQRPLAESPGAPSSSSSNESLPTLNKVTRPINSIVDDETEDDDLSSELQALQMRHQASKAQVEALIRST
ncbi:hypothetical protein Poli38472_009373 [Pythium oligandrum]|uniref:Uncharacterized protein n=1 Tax=Pythium oligandrum TaxID=41045 RepID=A0A8K1FJR3_PYTOL|nr:hypothetical protein Poli38472_009373 [Pythium oligandrum]|eukprot:TMW65206.1 hypothetical protein Poli38472_009373 [Pythium oligandrum]